MRGWGGMLINNLSQKYNFLFQKYLSVLTLILIGLPILNLVLNAVSWLRFGIDIPFMDDWRAYYEGGIGTFNLDHLFKPVNDTFYPVGLALDSLSYRLLAGNSIAYQFVSMITVLGLLLLLQWRLLLLAVEDKFLSAVAFCFTLLMLQPGSYWGLQNVAYHQAIPLICGMWALYLTLVSNKIGFAQTIALILLGLISGFSYISGAFLILVLGSILLVMSFSLQQDNELKKSGMVLIATSLITVPAQLWVIVAVQHGGTHSPNIPMAYPYQIDFWIFILGKIGCSLLLPVTYQLFSFIVTCVITLITISVVLYIIRKIFAKEFYILPEKISIIFLALSSIILIYLMLVAAGRTNDHPALLHSPLDIFILGYARFHFFWVTILWPWLIATIITIGVKQQWWSKGEIQRVLIVIMPIFIVLIVFGTRAFLHNDYYQSVQSFRIDGVRCLAVEMQKHGAINCPTLNPTDLSSQIAFAKKTHASFMPLLSNLYSAHSSLTKEDIIHRLSIGKTFAQLNVPLNADLKSNSFIDRIKKVQNGVVVKGWAFSDSTDPLMYAIAVSDETIVAIGEINEPRADVVQAFGDESAARSGFSLSIPNFMTLQKCDVKILALTGSMQLYQISNLCQIPIED
jgi:hypothetical protein